MATANPRAEAIREALGALLETLLPDDLGFVLVLYRQEGDGRLWMTYDTSADAVGQALLAALDQAREEC
jgi:hypothetical protein